MAGNTGIPPVVRISCCLCSKIIRKDLSVLIAEFNAVVEPIIEGKTQVITFLCDEVCMIEYRDTPHIVNETLDYIERGLSDGPE